MDGLPPDVLRIIGVFAPLFTERVWQRAQVLLIGAILTPGQRTVAAVLGVMGLSEEGRFKNYHRVLSRARWSEHEPDFIEVVDQDLRADGPVSGGAR